MPSAVPAALGGQKAVRCLRRACARRVSASLDHDGSVVCENSLSSIDE